ncbi:hypothetical protein E4T44_00159 [Aureobasidium sp. EXF-8845]|nr:hypothetical protein E4T44_00159 [Aureobasidium sp. EXF-8845]KAI4858287.1 hypothetical protein E4T45_00192 [Aureobasidium sp. EXF-8846]
MRLAQLFIFFDLTLVTFAQMTDHRIRDWLSDQIKQQKLSSLRFSGRHNNYDTRTLTTQEVLDFDFTAQCSEFVNLKLIDIKRSNVVDEITMITGEIHDEADEEELMLQATERLQSMVNSDDSITFDSVFVNREGMVASFRRWASLAKYGGRITMEVEDVSNALSPEHGTYWLSTRPEISIRAVWRYKWDEPKVRSTTHYALPLTPGIRTGPRPMTWNVRIQHAIVDGDKGVISLGDDISRGSPMVKAIAKYALHEPLTMQDILEELDE